MTETIVQAAGNLPSSAERLRELKVMREAIAEAIGEHRSLGHSIAQIVDGEVIVLGPGQY